MKFKKLSIFQILNEKDQQLIESSADFRSFNKDDVIVSHSTLIEHVYFVIHGRVVEVGHTMSGRQIIFNTLKVGDSFGLLSLISEAYSRSSLVAASDCEICAIPSTKLIKLTKKNTEACGFVLKEFSRLIDRLVSRMYEVRSMNVHERTCAELIRYSVPVTVNSKPMAIIRDLPTHEEIANTIFSHREAVTKEIGKLRKKGILTNYGNQMYLTDITELRKPLDLCLPCT